MIKDFIQKPTAFPFKDEMPWETVNNLCSTIEQMIAELGDGCRIGANAVLSPGTLLKPHSIVKRLELVEQDPQ